MSEHQDALVAELEGFVAELHRQGADWPRPPTPLGDDDLDQVREALGVPRLPEELQTWFRWLGRRDPEDSFTVGVAGTLKDVRLAVRDHRRARGNGTPDLWVLDRPDLVCLSGGEASTLLAETHDAVVAPVWWSISSEDSEGPVLPSLLELVRLWRRLLDQGYWQVQDPEDLGTSDQQWRRVREDLPWELRNVSTG